MRKRLDKEKVKKLYLIGYNSKEIAELLNIENAKELNLRKVKALYLMGATSKEIIEVVLFKDKVIKNDTIQRCINRNFSDCKFQHRKNRELNKELKKSVDNMNNSFISNRSLVRLNRQSYKYNKNNNLVFNEERGLKPQDMPKVFYR